MRLITLNTWAGNSLGPLMKFLKREAEATDIFCFQEVFHADQKTVDAMHPGEYLCGDLFQKMDELLTDFDGYFVYADRHPEVFSLAMFVRKTVPVREVGDAVIFDAPEKEVGNFIHSPRKIQYAMIETENGPCTVANYHGIFTGGSKKDTPERIQQSESIAAYLGKSKGRKLLCGDFNLLPDTESFGILKNGMRDLVTEHGVEKTRTPLYRHYHDASEPNFADYILVTPDVVVSGFGVLPDIVSDHSPLFVEFS